MLENEDANGNEPRAHVYAAAVISFWSWVRSCVFIDNIREKVAQYVTVPLGIIFLPPLALLKLICSNLQTVLSYIWRILLRVYELMLRLYDSVEEPRSGGLFGQIFGLVLYSLIVYGLYTVAVSRRFEVQDFKPSTNSATRQLELQLEGERARRKQMLDTESQVNVSEGLKRSAVLTSEGKLMALRNEIAGRYESQLRDAAAERATVQLQAEGLAVQIKTIAAAMGQGTSGKEAFERILEMRRIENYGKIAVGTNNATYFMKAADGSDVVASAKLIGDQLKK